MPLNKKWPWESHYFHEIDGIYQPEDDEEIIVHTLTRKYTKYIKYFLQYGELVAYSYDQEENTYSLIEE